ncbi:hypothetical protein P3T43_003372 [Paraburkholderia sp. GAS41]|jgi:hypothetical protein|uniref:hypothetical protein n=1 Tax=Paraburkholderia sp. GAS41 TaxID=3035134 RepID=UPI003D1B92EA
MSLIVAGRFTTFPAAEAAAQQLFDRGFIEEDVTLFFVNPPGQHSRHAHDHSVQMTAAPPIHAASGHGATIGAVAGAAAGVAIFMAFAASLPVVIIAAGVGAYLGLRIGPSLQARSAHAGHHERVHREFRNSGVLVAVHVSNDNQFDAAAILREAGASDLERASGHWQQGRWADFDPTTTPVPLGDLSQQHA